MSAEERAPGPLLLAAVALLSAAALGYEVLLTRLLAIVQWHHFAFMVIGIALLGFGASGVFLMVAGSRIRLPVGPFLALACLAFAVAAPVCFELAQRVPFNVLELPWSLRPFGWLFVVEILLALPFFIAATGIGRALVVFGGRLSRVYAADLAGAGGGAFAAIGLLYLLPVQRTLLALAAVAVLAAGLAALRAPRRTRWILVALAAGVLVLLHLEFGWSELRISQYKPLSQALRVSGAVGTESRSGPLGLVSAVENREVPLRWAPGLSLLARSPVPEQAALFVDGDGPTAVVRHRRGEPPPAYLDDLTSALPYHLLERPRVLVPGAGGGAAVLQALGGGARAVDAVELRANVVAIVSERFAAFSGDVYAHLAVRLHVADPRAFIEAADGEEFDLIQVDALGASPSGLHALTEERLLTVESIRTMLARLAPRGLLAVTGWSDLPPRTGPRVLATVLRALEAEGIGPAAAAERIAWIRSWNTTTLVAGRGPLAAAQVEATRAFARDRAFDLIHVPGMEDREANRFNVTERPWFRAAAERLLGPERDAFIRGYKFDIRPATDDRPWLFSFFKWSHAPEILALSRTGGIGLLAVGYLALPATLVQAAVASALFVLLPLAVRRRSPRSGSARAGPALGAFFCLGLAFLMMEIAFISRFTLILSHPLHAIVVVLAAFLVFAGVGSWLAGRREPEGSVARPAAGIVAIAATYIIALPHFTDWLLGAPPGVKIAAAVVLVAPLATLMGMPFPRTLARLRRLDAALVPWAWGTNGCASVVGAVLATLVAIHHGQAVVIGCAALLYATAAGAARHMERGARG